MCSISECPSSLAALHANDHIMCQLRQSERALDQTKKKFENMLDDEKRNFKDMVGEKIAELEARQQAKVRFPSKHVVS